MQFGQPQNQQQMLEHAAGSMAPLPLPITNAAGHMPCQVVPCQKLDSDNSSYTPIFTQPQEFPVVSLSTKVEKGKLALKDTNLSSPGHSPCGVLKCCSKQSAVVDVLCTVRHQIQRRPIALAVWRDIKQNQKITLCEPILAEGSQQTCAPGLSSALWEQAWCLGRSPGHSPCAVLKCCSKQSAVVDVLCTVRHQIQRRSIALAVWRDIKQNQKIILRSRRTSIHGHEQHKGTLADWKLSQ